MCGRGFGRESCRLTDNGGVEGKVSEAGINAI